MMPLCATLTIEHLKYIFIDVPEMLSKLNGTRTVSMMSNVVFECKAEGYPAPVTQWYKYGIRLQNVPVKITVIRFGFVVLVESSLIFKAVTRNDAAEYICEVENIVGRKAQSVKLNVLCELSFKTAYAYHF